MQSAADDRRGGDETGRDVEIDQASIEFGDRRFILPSHAGIDRQAAVDSPVVGNEAVIEALPQIFVGVAERNRARIRYAEEKAGEIRTGTRTAESERTSGI